MIAIDTNLLIYAHRKDVPWHATAIATVRSLWESAEPWMIPWPCIHEFYGIVTNTKIYRPASSSDAAMNQIDEWLESDTVVIGTETTTHWPVLRGLITQGRIIGPMVHDAKIAAICSQHGVSVLYTADRDFNRFPDLKCVNPLLKSK